jgi:hypothetical protein
MTQAEFNAAANIGSLPLRAQTAFDKLKSGKLPPELEQELYADIKRGTQSKASMAANLRSNIQKGAPVSSAAPTAPSAWTPPAGAPPAPKENGKLLKSNGAVVAKSLNGSWVEP